MESDTEHKAKQPSLAGVAASISFVATNTFFVCFLFFVFLLRQKYPSGDKTCHDKYFLLKGHKLCLSQQIFLVTKVLSRKNIILYRQMFYRDKHTFIATKDVFVATKLCRDKYDTCGSSRQ